MRSRPFIWILLCLLCLSGAWLLWPRAANPRTRPSALPKVAAPSAFAPLRRDKAVQPHPAPSATNSLAAAAANGATSAKTNQFAYRLSNTSKTIGQLAGDRHAILLENALIDSSQPLNFSIPKNLQSPGDPGAYIVQARGPIDNAFRAMLAAAGAQIVSYIPNDAYLVRAPAGVANGLAGNPLTQAVTPYEPYYKISSSIPVTAGQKTFSSAPMKTSRAAGPSLLILAMKQAALPAGTYLTLGLFNDGAAATVAQIEKLGGQIIARDKSPFGPVVRVTPPTDWVALATLPGVQIVEPYHPRIHANDLSRATVGVAADAQTATNYLNLSGSNVLVQVNDSGIDAMHPDFTAGGSLPTRVLGAPTTDTDGHGTHVAGIIAGDGTESTTVTNAPGSILTNIVHGVPSGSPGQFRGMAPLANLLSMDWNDSDQVLQEAAARTNALISNNSWNNGGDTAYDLAAASYDAAVRDALPEMTGSQPVLFVFSAGNDGGGDDSSDPGGGTADTIESPATAKNVITVGAIQEYRNITNIVTTISADGMTTNFGTPWALETSTSYRVAGFSSRGNVGIGTEGTYGRYKPDVVAPGTFVVSTRSSQWDITNYFLINPTNNDLQTLTNIIVQPDAVWASVFPFVPNNAVGVSIEVDTNARSPVPFPDLPVYVWLYSSSSYDFFSTNDPVVIPGDPNATFGLQDILNTESYWGFNYAVSNSTTEPISFNLTTDLITTNNPGDYFLVLSNLDQSIGTPNPSSTGPGPYYRYETGTSMSAADVSGVLALMQDYFTNTLNTIPSPALLKAMLINGARATGYYNYQAQNSINYEGWGLINLPDSVPAGITTNVNGAGESMLILDQSPTNALATGDSHTFTVQVSNPLAAALSLRITLAWTDPPGDPAAAIKLVNDLNLVVTNLSNSTNPGVYYGNDIPADSVYNTAESATNPPVFDSINNVENVCLRPGAATNFSVTVTGYRVNVNAVTAQTNNVVQDYALVISCGEGEVTNAFTVTDNGIFSNPTGDQQITFVTTTNQPLLNQIAGASSPLLGTNTLTLGTNTTWGSNGVVTLGLTNQWHFYVVTNTGLAADYTNAAFITFIPSTLAIPRMGVFADSTADATRPEADIDLYVAGPNDPNASGLTNLDPTVISNCLAGANGDAASLSRGGTEYVIYTNSVSVAKNPGAPSVYYIGVYSEDREAAEYGFIPIFTYIPFSQAGPNGSQIVNGLNVPVDIPDGSPAHPGKGYVFAIALYPMAINRVVVTNVITHQNFGDLIGTLSHGNSSGASQSIVLNNHDSLFNPLEIYTHIYDDSGRGDIVGSQPSDGPGSLNSFVGQQGIGVWMLTEVDDSLTQTGSVAGFNLLVEPHQDLTGGITNTLAGGTWFYTYIDVSAGFTNLSIFATNLPPTSTLPLQLYLDFNVQPDFTNYLEFVLLTNGLPPGNSISYGPPLLPGRYFVGVYNPDTASHNVELLAVLGGFASAIEPGDYTTNNRPTLRDDAVNSSTIFVSSTQQIASLNVGFVVEHPRISDLTFTLVSPTGQRILLMENRGGTTTNGAGDVFFTTNNFAPVTATGFAAPETNYLNVGRTSGELTINYDMLTIPDQMTVYYGTNSSDFTTANALFNSGFVSYTGTITVNFGPGSSTYVTIIMNQFGNPNGGTAWTYTAGGVETNYNYLAFTEDTNLATIPIKFAIPPFNLADFGTNYILCDFELATNGDYFAPTNIFDARGGWNLVSNQVVMMGTNLVVLTNQVSVVTDPANAAGGSNFLALANGTISRVIPMTPGRQFNLTFMYRGPGIAGWWRGEGNATDSSDPENNGNNGELIGRFNFPAGEVGQAFQFEDAGAEFQFAGTNTYVQIRQAPFLMLANTNGNSDTNLFLVPSTSLDVGTGSGFTIEGWINPTNASLPQPLVEWLARVPTNGSDTNLVIAAGPFLDRATGHYYYLLGSTNWTTSELWATQLGGHLATIETANEENWVYDTFAQYGGTNRNLWIGLTNDPANPTNFVWVGGQTNVIYTNWAPGGPTNCSGKDIYTAILGQTNAFPGLWVLENNSGADNNGVTCGVPPTNHVYGVVEVEEIQTNGVQLWISVTVTNDITSSNSCLYANLVDTTNGSHIIYSASGLVQSNVYQHVALTYSTNSGLAALYYNGTNVATTNLGVFVPKTTGDVLLGRDMSRATNNFYGGKMDEMSIYRRCLSASEIAAIYHISALSTNRNVGKFDPSITPALGLAEARVSLGGLTNIILGANNIWQSQSFSFTATTNSLPLQITGMEPGMLLDSFSVAEAPLGNLYYLPEQSLDSLIGTSAYGTWTLEIWDNRAEAFITNSDQLLSWQLQIVLQTNTLPTVALPPQETTTITVPPGLIVYLTVDVPSWANFATNVLVSATAPVDLLFNQTNPPTGSNPNDFTFLTNSTGGSYTMSTNLAPPLLPGQTYYLGVRNSGPHAVTAVVRVDFDITTLTNGAPLSSVLTTNVTDVDRYFAFDVTGSAYEATFQLLQLSGNADLVVRKGTPLPTLTSSDYGSFNAGNVDENIYVLTNSSPVPLSAGRWYLGVFPRDPRPIKYTILAKELDLGASMPTIIDLTNGVPFNFTAGPGAALTNFFRFTVTNTPPAIRFELYNLSGNGDLTVQTNAPPFAPPFFQSSQQPGRSPELIFMATNSALSSLTNSALTNLNAQWYLGVPNREITNISFTILAVIGTNGYFPAFPGAGGAGGGAAGGGGAAAGGGRGTNGTVYHVYNLNDSGPGSLRDAVSATNRTVVFDVSGTINLLSPLVITNSYLTIAGQTAPHGITVAGQMTTVQFAHDVIIRDLRFRPGVATNVAVVWANGFEGAAAGDYARSNSFDGWMVVTNQVTVISNATLAYSGNNLLALADGVISNILPTVAGQTYTLRFAYRGPGAISLWRGEGDAVDPISGNNGTPVNDLSYAAGEVNLAFNMGTAGYVFIPASPSLDVGPGPGFTIDAWIDPTAISASAPYPIIEWSQAGGVYSGQSFFVSSAFLDSPGCLFGGFVASNNVMVGNAVISAPNIVAMNVFQHVALTYNRQTGGSAIYLNGVMVASTNNVGSFVPWTTGNVLIGRRINIETPSQNFHFLGKEDEISIYGRDLSASEIQAIFQKGGLGKYDISAPSIASGLAEAQVTVGGTPFPIFFGNNTNWQTTNITFTATQSNTVLQITGIEPGMLLDAVSLTTNLAPNSGDSLQFTNVMDMIADHVSTSWSTNDLVSVLDSTNVTVQWSILADSLYNPTNEQGCGSVLRFGSGALSFNHNLYANNYSASPHLDDNLSLDFVNNVIYNWGIHSGYSGTNDVAADFTNQLNYACNYLIAGPDTAIYSTNAAQTNFAFWGGTTNTWIFQTNNIIDSDTNGILNGANTEWGMFTNLYTPFGRPFPLPPVPTDEAFIAYEKVLDFAGVSLFARDWVDADIVTGVRTQTGRIISTPPSSGLVAWWPGEGNANDISGNNNNGRPQNITYVNGEVGKAFHYDGSTSLITVPASTSLAVSNMTIECWIFPTDDGTPRPVVEYGGGGQISSIALWINTTGGGGTVKGGLQAYVRTGNTAFVEVTDADPVVTTNQWNHLAFTVNAATLTGILYCNGVQVGSAVTFPAGSPVTPINFGSAPVNLGYRDVNSLDLMAGTSFLGNLDEISIYNRALSASEIAAIYNAGSAGKYGLLSPPPPLDSDQDGIPDYWEITFGTDPFVASNNQLSTNANYIGYTDLEEYLGWLAAPHALTVTNTTVDVDLYRLAGDTGNLSFFVTNGVNGTVYLTNVLGSVTNTGPFSNSIAVFTPATNYSGYASFDFFVTNNDTVAWFGPVTVSVVVSAVPVLNGGIITLTNMIPYNDPTGTNGVDYYRYDVSTNATGVEFEVLNPTGNVTLLARYGLPLPRLGSYDYISANPGTNNQLIVVLTNSLPVPLTSGWWYLAVSNASGGLVSYTILASELGASTNPPPVFLATPPNTNINEMTTLTVTNAATDANTNLTLSYVVEISVDTNAMTANGWPLNYVGTVPAPVISNNGIITWTPSEAQGPGVYIITTIVVDNGLPPSSAQNSFIVTVNEVNTPPFWPANVPSQTNYIINDLSTLTVMNTATDTDIPPNPLTYQLAGPTPTNATIDTNNGVITWTPTLAQAGTTNTFVTIVTDTNAFALVNQSLSATNSFTVIVTTLINLTGGQPQTNTVGAGGIAYYVVNVPTNADFATNILLFATAPVQVWFDTNNPPTTNRLLLPDVAYPGGTNGSAVLSTNTTPPLVPGSIYYLGVQNTNSFAVTFGIEVDFHLLTSTNPPPPPPPTNVIVITSITATNNGFLLQWQGPTNFQYEIQWTTNLAPAVWNTVLNPVINIVVTTTNGHFSFFDDGTLTGGLGPMKFYRVLGSLNLGPITGPGSTTNTVLAGAMSQAVVTVPANALWASNVLLSATGPLNVWFNQTNPPTGNTSAGDFLMLSATSAGVFVLTSNSVPPLVPGTNYYLGFQNPGAGNVTFVFQVAFGFAPTNAVSNFSITATNGGIWLKWNGLTNYQYQVQWTTNLASPVAWNTISNIVLTSTTGIFTFFDDGSLTGGFGPMKFYRLIAWPFMTPIPQTLTISSVTVTNIGGINDLILKWSAPTNYQYGIQWTTNLSLSFSNWVIIASPVLTLTNGVYTFIDNGQTGLPASAKFFRIFDY
jgi:subtilisin-like proprotein convertase family protein